MAEFDVTAIKNWVLSNFKVSSQSRDEMQFPCPSCNHPSFYFNIYKQVGYCHRASCGITPTIHSLIEIVGVSPESGTIPFPFKEEEPLPNEEVKLPINHFFPVVYTENEAVLTSNKEALDYLVKRGFTSSLIQRFDLRVGFDGRVNRIYVPIYENKKLVNYVARIFQKGDERNNLRYKYAKGVRTSDYLFDWDSLNSVFHQMVLVENTFVSIVLNNTITQSGVFLKLTTNFGSHLSNTQINKIKNSNIKSVLLLWDEGSDRKAHKACLKLREQGINASYFVITGQPDDWHWTHIRQFIEEGFQRMSKGEIRISNFVSTGPQIKEMSGSILKNIKLDLLDQYYKDMSTIKNYFQGTKQTVSPKSPKQEFWDKYFSGIKY